jgi:hypothetical protein
MCWKRVNFVVVVVYEPEEEEALVQLLDTPTNSTHQSTVTKDPKFRKS